MRVLQISIPISWYAKSSHPATSIYSLMAMGTAEVENGDQDYVLVDDQHIRTRTNPMILTTLDGDAALGLWAKDADTLVRGMEYVARHSGINAGIQAEGGQISAYGLTWDYGDARHRSKLIAGICVILNNMFQLPVYRFVPTSSGGGSGKFKWMRKHHQSLSSAMRQLSRDGLLVSKGVGIVFVRAQEGPDTEKGRFGTEMDSKVHWSSMHRQIGQSMSYGTMAKIARNIFGGARVSV